MNFVNFLRAPISIEHLWWLLLNLGKLDNTHRCKKATCASSTKRNFKLVTKWLIYAIFLFNDTHRKKLASLNSVQKFIGIQDWLLLTFFICLRSQLSSFNSIIIQMSEKTNSSNRRKNEWLLLSVTFTTKF